MNCTPIYKTLADYKRLPFCAISCIAFISSKDREITFLQSRITPVRYFTHRLRYDNIKLINRT